MRAEHRVDPPHQEHRKQDQRDIDQAVHRLGELAVALRQGQAAPERQKAAQMQPEGEILRLIALQVDEPCERHDGEPEDHRDAAPLPPSDDSRSCARIQGVRSMDMNHSANAMMATMNGKG